MKTNQTPIILVSILLAAAIAVSSSPFHQGWAVKYAPQLALSGAISGAPHQGTLTGAVPAAVPKPVIGTPTVTTDTPAASTVDIKPGFWEKLITDIFDELEVVEPEETPEESAPCCADTKTQEIEDRVNELQAVQQETASKVEELTSRLASCAVVDPGTASCIVACRGVGKECITAISRFEEREDGVQTDFGSGPTTCDDTYFSQVSKPGNLFSSSYSSSYVRVCSCC